MDTDELRILLDNDLYDTKLDLASSAGSHGSLYVDDDTGELDVDAFYEDSYFFNQFVDEVKDTVMGYVDEDLDDVDWDEIACNIAEEYY